VTEVLLRRFRPEEAQAVNELVFAAYAELAPDIPMWTEFQKGLGTLVDRAEQSEVIVAESAGRLVGAVGYVGPGQPKRDFFKPEWPIVRLLSVLPDCRGAGIGRLLVQRCVDRTVEDQAELLALHTTPVMRAAQKLYAAFGFERIRELPEMYGVPYSLFVKRLAPRLK